MTFAFQHNSRKTDEPAVHARGRRADRHPVSVDAGLQPSAAMPLVFAGTIGLYKPAAPSAPPSATAVLFAGPWGLEELSTRKFFRVLADHLALRGVASLRFDYPGTGDALDPADGQGALSDWCDTLVEGARLLGSQGHQRIILVGQSLGAALALEASARIANLDAMALLAPVISGRSFLRELSLWSTVVDDSLKLRSEDRLPAGTTAIAGLAMSSPVATAVGRIKLSSTAPARQIDYLLLERPGQIGSDDLIAHLQAGGGRTERLTFAGYEALIASPTTSRLPHEAISGLVDWVDRRKAPAMAPLVAVAAAFNMPGNAVLRGEQFVETPVRFGEAERLYGVLCEPNGERRGATVILLGSAYDRHSGWGRLTVRTARALAASGIASLRFDCANVGDSPASLGAPTQVLYAPEQQADVAAALDFLDDRSLLPAVAVGRCSGAYLAFRTALDEKRLSGLVAVNPYAFCWNEDKPLQDDLRAMPQSLDTYWRKMISGATIGRILRGEIDILNSGRNVVATICRKIEYQIAARLGVSLTRGAERAEVYEAFQTLADRHVPVTLLYSRGDVGLDHLHYHFGDEGAKLARYREVEIEFLDGADHNLTPEPARAIYLDKVKQMALRF